MSSVYQLSMIRLKIIGGCFFIAKKTLIAEGKRNIIASLLQEYDIRSTEDTFTGSISS